MKMKFYVCLPLLILVNTAILAQNPGGVSTNLKLWVKSNSGTATTGALVDSWTYANDGTKSFLPPVAAARPTLVSNVINFNPSVRFTPGGTNTSMDGPTGVNAPIIAGDDDYTIFTVWKSNSITTFQRVWSQRTTAGASADAFAFSTWDNSNPPGAVPGAYGAELGIPPFSQGIQRLYLINTFSISQINMLPEGANDIEIIDDHNFSSGVLQATSGATRAIGTQIHRIGDNWDNGSPLNGDIAEIIVYDASISAGINRTKIFSYLAMKYGIHIGTDFINAAGTTVWNATTNATYNNSVFGIGRDDASGLTVSQSNSMNTGSGNGTGQNAAANIVISNPSSLDDQDFLMIGNDNGALTESGTDLPAAAAGSLRLGREWKIQRTGNPGFVNISFDLNNLNPTGGLNPLNYRLMVDVDGNGNFTNGTIRYYTPSSVTPGVNGGLVAFNNVGVSFNNNEVFALLTSATGGTPLPVNWKDFTVNLVNKDAHLNWSVENNADANRYEVEHSTDGITFTKIATISNIVTTKSYGYVDRGLLSGNHSYRIKQIDNNGVTVYSKIVNVNIKGADFTIYLVANPVKTAYAEVGVNAIRNGIATIELWSTTGAKISTQKESIITGSNKIKVPMDRVASGNYILKVSISDQLQTIQVLKQ